jgi:hypothetical protein
MAMHSQAFIDLRHEDRQRERHRIGAQARGCGAGVALSGQAVLDQRSVNLRSSLLPGISTQR